MLTEATIFRGAFWFSIGALLERVTFFLLPIFIAPLGPAVLGIFYLSLRLFNIIVSFPANILNAQYTGKLRHNLEDPKSLQFEEKAAFFLKIYLLVGFLLGIFFFALTITIAPLKSFTFLALSIPFAIVNSYMMLLLRLLQRFKQIFFIQAVFAFGFLLLYMIIFIKFFRLSIAAAFAGQLFMAILTSIAASVFVFDRLNLLGFFGKLNLKTLALSRLPLANAIFTTLFPIIDIALVGLLFGFSILGHYIVLLYLPLLMHKIPTTIFSMFHHVAIVKTRKSEEITEISKQVFKWILIITIPVFVVIMIFPEVFLSVLFHKAYVKDLDITRLFAISFFIQIIGWTAGRILIVKKKTLFYTATNYTFGLMFLLFAFFFVPSFGIFGVSLAYLIFSVTDALVKYILVITKTNVLFIGRDHIKVFFAGAMGSLAAYVLFFNNPLLFFPFFLLLYFAILWITGVVSPKTLSESLRGV